MTPTQKIILRSDIAYWKNYREEWGDAKWQEKKPLLRKSKPAWYAKILIARVEA